jgi:hypothetical protein
VTCGVTAPGWLVPAVASGAPLLQHALLPPLGPLAQPADPTEALLSHSSIIIVIIIIMLFLPRGKMRLQTSCIKGCQNPAAYWTRQIQARPNQPWARCSVFIPPPASRDHSMARGEWHPGAAATPPSTLCGSDGIPVIGRASESRSSHGRVLTLH